MKRKNKVNVMLLTVLSFFAFTTVQLVNAQNGEQIENVVEQIQEHNEREEDIREELKNLSLNELESVDEYLSSKPDITMNENQILTLTQELLSNGSSVNYVVQENLNTAERKEELRSEAQKSVENLSDKERKVLMNELQSDMDKSIEEEVMYEELLNIADKEAITTQLLLGIGTALFGAFIYALDKDSPSAIFAGALLFSFGLGLIVVSLFTLYT